MVRAHRGSLTGLFPGFAAAAVCAGLTLEVAASRPLFQRADVAAAGRDGRGPAALAAAQAPDSVPSRAGGEHKTDVSANKARAKQGGKAGGVAVRGGGRPSRRRKTGAAAAAPAPAARRRRRPSPPPGPAGRIGGGVSSPRSSL